MDHLSVLDASFLYLETPETPMHVGGLNLIELAPGYAGDFLVDFRRHIESRMHLAPLFQRKLLAMPFALASPVWVADDDMDMDYHIQRAVLPKPGSRAQLDRLVGRLHSSLLDRSRPLWQFHVIEGLQSPPDAPAGTRHVAFYSKVHHAALDGVGGMALANALMDTGPVARDVPPPPTRRRRSAAPTGQGELALAGLKNAARQTVKLVKSLSALSGLLGHVVRQKRAPDGPDADIRSDWFAPPTPLNVKVSGQRIFASCSVPLAELKQIAKGNAVSLNDVVLAICSGALRRYLAAHGGVPAASLLAGMPVSLREAGSTEQSNQVSMVRVSLASTLAAPLARLQAIHHGTAGAKATSSHMKRLNPNDFPSLGAPWLLKGLALLWGRAGLAERLPPIANVIISNVPGPHFPLYVAGAKMLTYYPVSIPTHSVALNITVQSYNGALDFGLIACRQAVPDLPKLARLMRAAHHELLQLTPALPTGGGRDQRAYSA